MCLCRLIQGAFVDMENMLALLTEQKEVSHLPRAFFFFIVEFILDHVYSDAATICGDGLGFDVAVLTFKGHFSFGEYI